MQMSPIIIQLCASHISTVQRMRSLVRQLNSIKTNIAPVWLSISCEPDLLDSLLVSLEVFKETVTIRLRERKLYQFQHYALLATEIPSTAWCLMCDDDDICHPYRVPWYCSQINDEYESIFCSNGQVNLFIRGSTELDLDSTNSHVLKRSNAGEYWMFAARASMLQLFCALVRPKHLASVTCDLLWRNFLRLSKCKISESSTWLYAKTMESDSEFGHISLSTEYDIHTVELAWDALKPVLMKSMNLSADVVHRRELLHWESIFPFI